MNVQNIALQNSERRQAGSLFTPEHVGHSAVLLIHGYQSNRSGYAEYAEALTSELGATCLTIDLAGHGDSAGDLSELSPRDHLADVCTAYDFLSSRPDVDPSRIGVMGASYGGYLAVLLSQERGPKSLLLRAPAIYEDALLDTPKPKMDDARNNQYRQQLSASTPLNRALRAARDFKGNLTVVESEHDESIVPSVMQAYLRVASNGTHHIVKGAGHSLRGKEREVFKGMLLDWAVKL